MIRKIGILFAATALAAGGVALAQDDVRPMRGDGDGMTRAEAQAGAEASFARMDADNDGRLTPADRAARRTAMQAQHFTRMDGNSDGSISRAEWDAAHTRMADRRDGAGRGRADGHHQMGHRGGHEGGMMGHRGGRRGGHHGGGMGMMRGADADNDGAISRQEFVTAALARFDRTDADRDGTVTRAERQVARAAHRAARQAAPAAAPAN